MLLHLHQERPTGPLADNKVSLGTSQFLSVLLPSLSSDGGNFSFLFREGLYQTYWERSRDRGIILESKILRGKEIRRQREEIKKGR